MSEDALVKYFAAETQRVRQEGGMPMWTIYDKPTDFPDSYVMRLFDFDKATGIEWASTGPDLLRKLLIRMKLHKIPRNPNDHHTVVESWM